MNLNKYQKASERFLEIIVGNHQSDFESINLHTQLSLDLLTRARIFYTQSFEDFLEAKTSAYEQMERARGKYDAKLAERKAYYMGQYNTTRANANAEADCGVERDLYIDAKVLHEEFTNRSRAAKGKMDLISQMISTAKQIQGTNQFINE